MSDSLVPPVAPRPKNSESKWPCKSCGNPYSPTHDIHAPGPTVRHPFFPAEPLRQRPQCPWWCDYRDPNHEGACIPTAERERNELRAENEQLRAELDRLHSWAGLIELLDEHWPADIFPGGGESTDLGPRVVGLIRESDRLRAELAQLRAGVQATGQDQAVIEAAVEFVEHWNDRGWRTGASDATERFINVLVAAVEAMFTPAPASPPPPTSEPIPAPTAPPEEDDR